MRNTLVTFYYRNASLFRTESASGKCTIGGSACHSGLECKVVWVVIYYSCRGNILQVGMLARFALKGDFYLLCVGAESWIDIGYIVGSPVAFTGRTSKQLSTFPRPSVDLTHLENYLTEKTCTCTLRSFMKGCKKLRSVLRTQLKK